MGRPGHIPPDLPGQFEVLLSRALKGCVVPSCVDLDMRTIAALNRVAGAYPDADQGLVEAAHSALAGQMDGSNAIKDRDELMRRVLERRERRPR
ncbi:hypothetical protein [Nocardia sp. A7]|uniref:hypothetical protein n=1 Tax=Nocardia sp. A7 TaxID=2789274 RepID=UPI00397844C0